VKCQDCKRLRRISRTAIQRPAGAPGADRSQFCKDLSVPFYGYNRPGAKVWLAPKILKGAKLKIHIGASHGTRTTLKNKVNEKSVAFIRS
jgi:hypothetical protein